MWHDQDSFYNGLLTFENLNFMTIRWLLPQDPLLGARHTILTVGVRHPNLSPGRAAGIIPIFNEVWIGCLKKWQYIYVRTKQGRGFAMLELGR